MARTVHVPYTTEQDETGFWTASAHLRPGAAAFGEGETQETAVADLRVGLKGLIEEVGIPDAMKLAIGGRVARTVHVPYTIEQDEDGVWCASAQLRPGVAAFGNGATREAALTDLRGGLELLIEEVGPPDAIEITIG